MLTRVRAQRSRSPRFLQHSRLPSSRPSPTLGLKPVPFPRVPGSLALGQCAQGSRSQRADEEAGSEFKANFASAARSAAPRARQGGRRRAVPRRQPVARPPGTRARPLAARSLTSLPPPTTWSRPARGGLGAARQPAHMHMRATERAACIPERAPRARTPTLARARRYRRYWDPRGSAMQAHCFPAALYLVARPGFWDPGRALRDKPRPRHAPSR